MEWRPIPGFPAHAIREDGLIMRVVKGKTRPAGWIVKVGPRFDGYLTAKLTVDGRKFTRCVHRLVALAFLGPPLPGKAEAAHWDGDKLNNHVSNLRWASTAENGADTARHGTRVGERNGRAKLTWEQVQQARAEYTGKWGEQSQLARKFGVKSTAMRSALLGEHWRGR
jgi:hypothetical protein